ncbi:MAG TPA: hypothetical protein VKI65_02190 [Gemmataceae bacterium]|nr:hypothetical protein [Gemmataceae bacterium]
MRRFLIPALAVGFAFGVVQRAPAADEPKDIIAKAIKAYGGEEKLSKLRAGQSKSKGKIELFGGISFTQETYYQLPGKFKEVTNIEVMGNQATIITVYNGKEGWLSAMGNTQELDGKLLEEVKEGIHLSRIARLVTLKEKEFELSPLGDAKVNGKEAVGVKVASKGHRDANLFFDKKTNLLAKVERRGVDPQSGKEFNEERIMSDYRPVSGIQSPKKIVINRDGKKFMEIDVEEVKILDKIDDSEFAKP